MGTRTIQLDGVRTDGWFERIGDSIGSFHALCEIVGERFFAFSLVAGVRITALTVDRRSPDSTIVEYVVGDEEAARRATLPEFRRQVVGALLTVEQAGPAPTRETDLDAVQAHIGIRYLLLAPLFGISLRKLVSDERHSRIVISRDGFDETVTLEELRAGIGVLVRQELDRVSSGARGAIDLAKVADAEAAAAEGNDAKVVSILGSWPAPLAIFLRTPEGQSLAPNARLLIAKALGLLGTSCARLREFPQAEEILRLGIQWAGDNPYAGELFRRLGETFLAEARPGEAIAPLRRALVLGAAVRDVAPLLVKAYVDRGRYIAAYGCLRQAIAAGVSEALLVNEAQRIERALGRPLAGLRALLAAKPSDH